MLAQTNISVANKLSTKQNKQNQKIFCTNSSKTHPQSKAPLHHITGSKEVIS